MLGFLTALVGGTAAATTGIMRHLMDQQQIQKGELELQKKEKEIKKLQAQVEDLEDDNQRLRIMDMQDEIRKLVAKSNKRDYIKFMGQNIELQIGIANLKAGLKSSDPYYKKKLKDYNELQERFDARHDEIECELGEFKPHDMSMEDIYQYYLKYIKDYDDIDEAAATDEENDDDEESNAEIAVEMLTTLKSDIAKMEKNLVNDGSAEYKERKQKIEDEKLELELAEDAVKQYFNL